jgi:hypothetical protein
MRRLIPLCLVAAAASPVAGCGNERQEAPKLPPASAPSDWRAVDVPQYGLRARLPGNWPIFGGPSPLAIRASSGRAVVAVWRFRRVERLPRSAADLSQARRALLAAIKARQRTVRVDSARSVRVSGIPGIEVLATERIGGAPRQVRSTHLYGHGAELVIDAYAPAGEFARVDRTVFRPLLRSLRLTRPQRR